MSRFPIVETPCPYKGDVADILDGGRCTLCKCEVHDLTAMNDGEREGLVRSHSGKMCVSYRLDARRAAVAAALGASVVAVPAAASEGAHPHAQPGEEADAVEELATNVDLAAEDEVFYIIVGGLRKPEEAKFVSYAPEDKAPAAKPAMPVEYDDAPAKAKPAKRVS